MMYVHHAKGKTQNIAKKREWLVGIF